MNHSDLKILILEDNEADYRLVAEYAQEAVISKVISSVAITRAKRLSETLETLKRQDFDIVLCDLDLPDSNGLATLSSVAEAALRIPVVVLTGIADEKLGKEMFRKGAQDYLVKDKIQSDSLMRSVKYAIERKKASEALRWSEKRNLIISEAASAMLAAEDPQALVDRVCVKTMEFIDCQVFFNFLVDEVKDKLRLNAYHGIPEEEARRIEWLDYGSAVCGCVARDGARLICEDISLKRDPKTDLVAGYGVRAYCCHPLMAGKRVIGTLSFGAKNRGSFSEADISVMKATADIVAVAMRRKQAEEILKRDKEATEELVEKRTDELVAVQIALERAKRLSDLGTLAATVAHELRNPLAAISVAASNIKRKAKDDSFARSIQNIENKVAESDQIITNLLYYSRIKPPNCESMDADRLIEECLDLARSRFQGKENISFRKNLPGNILIEVDPLQFREVLSNILNNSCDALPDSGGEVELSAENNRDSTRITVKDNGSGIDKDLLSRVFDPFFTTKAKGTGLGLAVCKQIVNLHGGEIRIESEPGKGTTVSIILPKKES